MLESLINACKTLVGAPEYNNFWVLSLARDDGFKRVIGRPPRSGSSAGTSGQVFPSIYSPSCDSGSTEICSTVLRGQSPGPGHVGSATQAKAPTSSSGIPGFSGFGLVESKLAYECTLRSTTSASPRIIRASSRESGETTPTRVCSSRCSSWNAPLWITRRAVGGSEESIASQARLPKEQRYRVSVRHGGGQDRPEPVVAVRRPTHKQSPCSQDSSVCGPMVSLLEDQFIPAAPWRFDP